MSEPAVNWHEGMFLRPHHFQAAARHLHDQLRESGRWEQERESVRLSRALDRVASEVERIPADLAAAREKLWTPEKEKQPSETKLWTPGSKESA